MLTLLMHLSLDLITFGSSKMSKLITLPTLPLPEIDLSLIHKLVLKFSERYGHRGSDDPASVNVIYWLIDSIRNNLILLLADYTSASGSLNSGMIIINYFLVTPKFIWSFLKYISRFSMHNTIKKTIPHINHSVSEKEFTQIILRTIFLKSQIITFSYYCCSYT